MIEAAALAAPITDLLDCFGSGVVASGGPADALRLSSAAIDAVHIVGRDAIRELDASWLGKASTAAVTKARNTQDSAVQISDRGNAIAEVVDAASADVNAGLTTLQGVLQSFISLAVAAAPTLGTPAGLAMIIAAAIEHLDRALVVVAKVRAQLATHTARMTELTAPAVPSGSSGGTLAPDAGPGEHRLVGKGVEITLPDGSTAIAPNEQAATAVRAALSQQGVPYVWGGTSPGVGLDCSGLTKYAYGEAGVDLPRLAQEQNIGHARISEDNLMPGDLAVWDGHVAMVIGNGQLVEAGDPVSTGPIRTENCGMGFYGFYRPTS